MTDRWTAETEELVARTIFGHDEARKVLTALADAGLLLPPDSEPNRVYGRRRADGLMLPSALPDPTHYRLVGPWVPVNDGGGT